MVENGWLPVTARWVGIDVPTRGDPGLWAPAPVDRDRLPEIVGMQRLLEAFPEAMVVADAQGLILMVNSRLELLLGWTEDELVGRSIEVVVPDGPRLIRSAARAGGRQIGPVQRTSPDADLHATRKDGTHVPADITVA